MHLHHVEHDYTIKSIDNALKLLEVLTDYQEGASLAQLAARLDLTRNGVFRILRTLYAQGLVEQDPGNGCYRLGLGCAALAQKMIRNVSVISYAHPVLEDLARELDEAVYLTVLNNDEVLFIDMVDSSQKIRTDPLLGRLVPFFTNAAGKVMKSLDSRDLLQRLLRKIGRKRGGVEFEKLDRELDQIRVSGVAVDRGGLGEGIISVAVAVYDYSGRIVGAITLIAPAFRIMTDRLEKEIIPSLKEKADFLSGRFGYTPA